MIIHIQYLTILKRTTYKQQSIYLLFTPIASSCVVQLLMKVCVQYRTHLIKNNYLSRINRMSTHAIHQPERQLYSVEYLFSQSPSLERYLLNPRYYLHIYQRLQLFYALYSLLQWLQE
ncbi:hypothetical protein ACHAWT_010759 [Skeletonema menzelii]